MVYRFEIPGHLPGMNEYINKNRRNRYSGARMKKDDQEYVCLCIRRQLKDVRMTRPVAIRYTWMERDHRRDLDNITGYGHKVIQDALVECGVLEDDGWQQVRGFADSFGVSKENPRIIVELEEEDDG